jgi:DNA-binding MarR family transcriptional regulator
MLKSKNNNENADTAAEILERIEIQLALQNRLLMLLATGGDLSKHGREVQISKLAAAGVRQSEIAKFFEISPQAVQQAIKKLSKKK